MERVGSIRRLGRAPIGVTSPRSTDGSLFAGSRSGCAGRTPPARISGRAAPVRVELLQWVDVPTTGGGKKPMTELGFTHLSFRVDHVDDLTDAVVAAGGTVLPQTLSYVGAADARSGLLYYLDPDGTRIEVMSNVPDLSGLKAADVVAAATAT